MADGRNGYTAITPPSILGNCYSSELQITGRIKKHGDRTSFRENSTHFYKFIIKTKASNLPVDLSWYHDVGQLAIFSYKDWYFPITKYSQLPHPRLFDLILPPSLIVSDTTLIILVIRWLRTSGIWHDLCWLWCSLTCSSNVSPWPTFQSAASQVIWTLCQGVLGYIIEELQVNTKSSTANVVLKTINKFVCCNSSKGEVSSHHQRTKEGTLQHSFV